MIKRIIRSLLPQVFIAMITTLKNYKILSADFGQFKTMRRWNCVDATDVPIPWYTYPALEYLVQFDFSDKTVFEFGSGNSTLFWASRCKEIVSVEDDRKWYDKMEGKLPDNVEYHLLEKSQEYINHIKNYPYKFDIIIVDGSHRYECALEALERLQDDGFIILDNSDWKEKTSELLRKSDLIEVDLSGFGPINGYTWTTSLYLSRKVRLTPAYDRQPIHGIGSLKHRVG